MSTSFLSDALTIDLSHERFGRDIPFAEFAALRAHAPLFWYEPGQYWVASSHELVGGINQNPSVFSSFGHPAGIGRDGTIITMDPPEHTVYRKLVTGSFLPRAIRARRDIVQSLATELVDRFVSQGGGDWVTEVAALLPIRVMSDLMGISPNDEPGTFRWVAARVIGSDPEYAPESPEHEQRLLLQGQQFADRLIEEHRRNPRGGDLVDVLLEARVDGAPLSQDELRAWITLYLSGGAETTKHLIAHGLVCLLQWPDAKAAVIDGCDMPLVIEEMLRYVSPVMHHSRWPVESFELHDQLIKPGERTTLWMISANRDQAVFDEPDRFDVTRDPNRHDSFGAGGPHFCLGAGLTRLEATVMFETLRPHLSRFELGGELVRGQNNFFNLLKHCPVRVRSALRSSQ